MNKFISSIKGTVFLCIGLLALIILPACTSTQPGRGEGLSISGTVATVDRFGNITLDLSAEDVTSAGFALGDTVNLRAGSFNGIVPIVSSYSDVDSGQALVRLHPTANVSMLAVNMGNFAENFSVTEGSPVTINLAGRGAYLAELEIRTLIRSNDRDDYSSDIVFANFREARLGNIGANVIYRSTHPALNEGEMASRAPYARRLAEQARIVTVINLADHPHELPIRAANVPWYQTFITQGRIISLGMGIDYKASDFAGKLKTGIEFMLENNPPFLIHCNEGKDRAGVVTALFAALMGADPEAIVNDYMLSYENFFGVTRDEARYDLIAGIMWDILADFNGGTIPRPGGTTAAAERYLLNVVGLSRAQVNALSQKLAGL
ncbi:MAG: SAM-dependent chlorinase/fluorinase [Treponema sp.]|nr:SAM-dependent chlorinase/fluorinase [Treponema sp.]